MARKPYVVSARWYSSINGVGFIAQTRAAITGSYGTVTASVETPEGEPITSIALDILRVTSPVNGAPRGWTLTLPSGRDIHVATLSDACSMAGNRILDDARTVLKGG